MRLQGATRTDPCLRNYRTRLLPWVVAAKRTLAISGRNMRKAQKIERLGFG